MTELDHLYFIFDYENKSITNKTLQEKLEEIAQRAEERFYWMAGDITDEGINIKKVGRNLKAALEREIKEIIQNVGTKSNDEVEEKFRNTAETAVWISSNAAGEVGNTNKTIGKRFNFVISLIATLIESIFSIIKGALSKMIEDARQDMDSPHRFQW